VNVTDLCDILAVEREKEASFKVQARLSSHHFKVATMVLLYLACISPQLSLLTEECAHGLILKQPKREKWVTQLMVAVDMQR